MNNKTLKVIYIMRKSKIRERQIKINLKSIYNIECSMPELKRILENISVYREKYNELDKNKILYLYRNFKVKSI